MAHAHYTEAYHGHVAHCPPVVLPIDDRLHVVTMVSNPVRWRTRYDNYWKFEEHVAHSGAILYTVEVAFGDRPFEITSPDNPRHLQLRTSTEIWHKENALNLMIQRLPKEARYIAWVDADIKFARNDWAQETIQLLQHYDFIQMFSFAQDLTKCHEPGKTMAGFMYNWEHNRETFFGDTQENAYYGRGPHWHPGYAWAARKSSLDKVGMLIDYAIMGAADWTMACALVGRVEHALRSGYSDNYKALCEQWQVRAEMYIQHNVGYMPGLITHMYHGNKMARNYSTRHKLLVDTNFDPTLDLKRDWQGLWALDTNNRDLRDGLRTYNRTRNEDE